MKEAFKCLRFILSKIKVGEYRKKYRNVKCFGMTFLALVKSYLGSIYDRKIK